MSRFVVIDAPSNLGLWPSGVETLGIALKSAGLITQLGAEHIGVFTPPPFSEERDETTHLRNGEAIRAYSQELAEMVTRLAMRPAQPFPIILGGDCSILIGAMLGLRRTKDPDLAKLKASEPPFSVDMMRDAYSVRRYGLFFIDGHADFYQPEADPKGEVASMELAFITGRGPDILSNIDGLRPLVRDEDVVVFGYRDQDLALEEGSQDIRKTLIHTYTLDEVRQPSIREAAQQALAHFSADLDGFWIHLDADVLDDAIMPAVDYRIPGGLQFEELSTLLQVLLDTGNAVGMTITIFNPKLDDEGRIAQQFVEAIVQGLSSSAERQG